METSKRSRNGGNEGTPRESVLVIDDSEIARCQMVELLTATGMTVVDLPSPIGATMAILKNNVSVVVLDLYMPGMNGDKLAGLFRNNARLRAIGVVLVTGADEAELARVAATGEIDAFVSKARLHELAPAVSRARARYIARQAKAG